MGYNDNMCGAGYADGMLRSDIFSIYFKRMWKI